MVSGKNSCLRCIASFKIGWMSRLHALSITHVTSPRRVELNRCTATLWRKD